MGNFAIISLPGSFINSSLIYIQNQISLNLRKGLVKKLNQRYLKNKNFYYLNQLDQRIIDPDQILTDDLKIFTESLSEFYAEFSKPILDIILFTRKLAETVTWYGPFSIAIWFTISSFLIKTLTPAFGQIIAEQKKFEGEFRTGHQRILQHSEEIAFLRGENFELKNMSEKLEKMMKEYKKENKLKFFMGIIESMLTKYAAYNLGIGILSFPVFGVNKEQYLLKVGNDSSKIARDYEQNSTLLLSLAKALDKIVQSYKKLQKLAGITSRVSKMMTVMDDLSVLGRYEKTLVNNKELIYDETFKGNSLKKGNILYDKDSIKFMDVPIITPSGENIIQELTFRIKKGMNTVIIGPNGSGKTALLRILAGLWPFFKGQIHKLHEKDILFLPQIAYLPKGTLKDLIIYPHLTSKISDLELEELMEKVDLIYLKQREGGFYVKNDWYKILSGGEKQRINILRLFYHKPKFAILDEATSEISVEIENKIYMMAKELNITLITIVTQKKSFYSYHDYVLNLDGHGEWSFEKIEIEDR